jgi:hypothetical protein
MVSRILLEDDNLKDLLDNRDTLIKLMSHIKDYSVRLRLRKEIQELDTLIDIRVKEVLEN